MARTSASTRRARALRPNSPVGSYRPPAREGISPRKTVLVGRVPADVAYWAASAGDSPFSPGERLPAGRLLERPVPAWYHPAVPPEPPIPFHYEVLYADRDLIVVDKPHFLPTTSNGRIVRETVQTRLRVECGEDEIVPLHRLDRLTSGVVVCSRNPATRGAYQELFARRKVHKEYHALVSPPLERAAGVVDLGMRKERGERQVRVDPAGTLTRTWLEGRGDEVVLRPETGHTHQLRVLLDYLGSPIVGDDTYPVDKGLALYDFSTPLALVATSLWLSDPFTGKQRRFSISRDWRGTLGQL